MTFQEIFFRLLVAAHGQLFLVNFRPIGQLPLLGSFDGFAANIDSIPRFVFSTIVFDGPDDNESAFDPKKSISACHVILP